MTENSLSLFKKEGRKKNTKKWSRKKAGFYSIS